MNDILVQVVDEHDNPIGGASKAEIHKKGLWHRISRIVLEDGNGHILLQRRKDNDGRLWEGCWDTSAAGHVDEGETHYQAAVRELEEEIGLTGATLTEVAYYKTEGTYGERILNRWNRLYRGVISHDARLRLQEEEVAETKWFTRTELSELFETSPTKVSDGLRETYGLLFKDEL